MPLSFTVALLAVVALLLVLRLLLPGLPVAALARPVRGTDAALIGAGLLGLLLHCGVMFSPSLAGLPGMGRLGAVINGLGPGSAALFVVPTALLLTGLRGQQPLAWLGLALSLTAVGITMYNHGPLTSHLTAIFVSVVLLTVTGALLVSGPSGTRSSGGLRAPGASSSGQAHGNH